MKTVLWGFLLIAVAGGVLTDVAHAGIKRWWCQRCCQHCRRPHFHPTIPAPVYHQSQATQPVYQTVVRQPVFQQAAVRPVWQTQFRPQQVLTYRDAAHTEYRQEAYLKTVQVKTYESTLVDEGGYERVWVPKLVRKVVPRTAWQQQLGYRTVPYLINRRIPQLSTRYLPQQRLAYLPSVPAVAAFPVAEPVVTTSAGPDFPTDVADDISITPRAIARSPKPEANTRDTARKSTRSERSSRTRYDGYRPVRTSRFVPAPSAATVWQTRSFSRFR